MPQVLEPIQQVQESAPPRLRLTRTHCATLEAAGLLTESYELIDGEIFSKMGHGPSHAAVILRVTRALARVMDPDTVRPQVPINVGDADPAYNQPQPDVSVTRQPLEEFDFRHPDPDELLLVVEVSDTTLRFDRTKKAALYATAQIPEYWMLDLNSRRLLVHRGAMAGGWSEITAYGEDEWIATLARPEATIRVGDLLPQLAPT